MFATHFGARKTTAAIARTSTADLVAAFGYLLIGGLFVSAGVDHAFRFGHVRAMLSQRRWPMPGALLSAASLLELVAGLGLAFGVARAWSALVLVGFTVVASVLLLDFWHFTGLEREGMRTDCHKFGRRSTTEAPASTANSAMSFDLRNNLQKWRKTPRSWEEHKSYVKALIPSRAAAVALLGSTPVAMAEGGLVCEQGETYIMNVMVGGHPYWVPVFEGFRQAAKALGCEAVLSGTPDYDITKQIASFEQDLVKQPEGILLHPMQADPFIDPINRAIEAGVSVTTFAAESLKSKRTAYVYVTSDNLAEAKFAAEEIVKAVGDGAEYAVLENPGQSNHDLRVTALIAYMEKNYPNMKLVGLQATNKDTNAAFTAVSAMLQANPDLTALWIPEAGSAEGAVAVVKAANDKLVIIHADITPTTLEEINAGNIHMAQNSNQGVQGFVGFMNTFLGADPELIDPFND